MTPREREAFDAKVAARQAALSKFPDGTAVITDEDIKVLNGDEILQLADAGRLQHMNVGPYKRRRRAS